MGRYAVFEIECEPDTESRWLVLDTQTQFVVRLNGVWLEMLPRDRAEQMAEWLNWLDTQ
jgi:hypothetical protein